MRPINRVRAELAPFPLPHGTFLLAWLLLLTANAPANAQARALTLAYQLTHSVKVDPSLAPDGRRMVFITAILGREQLFVMNVDGTESAQLTHDDADHEDPAWSPRGDRIAFVRIKDSLETIYLMNADGSGMEALTPDSIRAIHPQWSPDGAAIAYCTDDDLKPPKKNPAAIYTIDVRDRRITRLISGGVNTYPAWSPDGKRIAFRRMLGEMNSEVFVANRDGSEQRNLTNHPAFDGWPAWSPDGGRIAFASNRNANYQIFTMNADGSDVRLVANTEGRATAPQWGAMARRSISRSAGRSTSEEIATSSRRRSSARGADLYSVALGCPVTNLAGTIVNL
jgi:TolB protein